MKQVLQGDRAAFGLIYDRYSDRLLRYFFRMLWNNTELAEDMVQDLFIKIIKKPDSYDPARPFKTWMFSVAHNMIKNQYKHAEVRKIAAEEIKQNAEVKTGGGVVTDKLEYSDFHNALDQQLSLMEPHHRDTFVLRYRQGLSVREVGEIMECPEGTVKSRLFYAVKTLALKLNEYRILIDG